MTSKSNANAHAETKQSPALIVFGLDQTGKPRAAAFASDQAELATKAAELMKLRLLTISSPELADLAARLPVGRIYASGHAFVPSVRSNIYDRLTELADPKPAPSLPTSWDDIAVGHLVLTQEEPGEIWWAAIVVAMDDDMLTLKGRDYPKYPPVVRQRASVALLNPNPVNA